MLPRGVGRNKKLWAVLALAVAAMFGQDFLTRVMEVVNAIAVANLPPAI